MIFGKKIKALREERGMVQRQLAAALEIDTPMFSMARLFEVDEKELLTIWLADKVLDIVEGEDEVKCEAVAYAQKEMKVALG